LSHLVTGGRASAWLDHETLTRLMNSSLMTEIGMTTSDADKPERNKTDQSSKNDLEQYLRLVYKEGLIDRAGNGHIRSGKDKQAQDTNSFDVGVVSFLQRWQHFSSGVFVGSKEFCASCFKEFREYFHTSIDRQGQRIAPRKVVIQGSLHDLFAIRRFHLK